MSSLLRIYDYHKVAIPLYCYNLNKVINSDDNHLVIYFVKISPWFEFRAAGYVDSISSPAMVQLHYLDLLIKAIHSEAIAIYTDPNFSTHI